MIRAVPSFLSRATWCIAPVLVVSLLAGASAAQAPGMPDPRQMSGLPRVDPQTEAGTIVIRVLRGSFQDPGVGLTVSLALRSADGGQRQTRTAVSVEQGRATFSELLPFAGGTAVASVDFGDGEVVSSQEIKVDPSVGVRMLLVQGAAPVAAAPAAASDVPRPGVAFPNPGQAKDTVVVGTLDLAGGKPFTGVEVRLEISPPTGPVETRKLVSDARGAARFADLAGLPPGSTLAVEATLNGELRRSEPFTLAGKEHGLAVVLAVTSGGSAEVEAPQRRPLQPPRALPTLPVGTVRATVVGPDDAPVAAAEVAVTRLDVTGTRQRFAASAGADGVARVEDITLADDALYQAEVVHQGAPFRSRLFQMTDRMGVAVELRVFPTTADVSKVRSAVQFGIEALENDQARVVQLHQAVVEGDAAFWPATPLRLSGPPEATGMVVLDRATVDLEHPEGAPFATLKEPLPPGELVDLSIAYLMPHQGALRLRWTTPFPVETGRVVLTPELKVARGAAGPPTRPPHQEGQGPVEFDLYDLGKLAVGGSFDVEVDGLVTRPQTFRRLGLGLGLLIGLGTLLAVVLRPRASLQQRLQRRKEALLRALDQLERAAGAPPAGARERLIFALDQVYRQLDVFSETGPKGQVRPGVGWERGA